MHALVLEPLHVRRVQQSGPRLLAGRRARPLALHRQRALRRCARAPHSAPNLLLGGRRARAVHLPKVRDGQRYSTLLNCAGEGTDAEFTGYLNGAYRTGIVQARALLEKLGWARRTRADSLRSTASNLNLR